ncbi:sporulation-delaying protein SdpB family protein [Streptomyces pratensis]|uniref:sporulation-delaying protein SdpB family protein n=1 Tax=Streptomyces pratensis TaxID=1169025 RepID=UPI003019BD80
MKSILSRVGTAVLSFRPESRVLGLGRTVLALAQASVLAFTPAAYLFVPVGGDEFELNCSAPFSGSAYCLADGSDRQLVTWFLLAALLVVASGLLPRYTSILHFWVSLSVHGTVTLPDGGETAAQVCTLFLVLASSNDRRTWHWQRPGQAAATSVFQGIAWAGHWGLRLQVAYIYLNSSIAKLPVESWGSGTAGYYVSRMESFGVSGLSADLFLWLTAVPLVALIVSWGTIVTEAAIAVLLVRQSAAGRAVAFALSAALHLGIIMALGLVSFGLTMIGLVMCATAAPLSVHGRRLRSRLSEKVNRQDPVAEERPVDDAMPSTDHGEPAHELPRV